ncbi:LysR family transcriptional regulator [Asticcacaulis sp. ZE23SCel15]|uniref:LysR family transcriptional regulator n=1 Tax=Asticcacaulis sp. ZE23SCel15 TaxID=3059027 RepID=UPI00265DBAE7|nr:LysR family transcriptional regulator [Asticcacaulis sp. ZE23SCel15]WKL58356.1 LysR family transcriptional regulator [Asticcacaulis sp. ZE23SCel15]
MDPYLLRYFLAVVETGSFTKAANASSVTQPTLSAGIKRLEETVGAALFVRNNKRVFLTTAGARFLPRAKTILHECNLALAEVAQGITAPVLRLGVLHTLPSQRIAGLIKSVRAAHPETQFELSDGTEQELLNRMDERGIDFALSIRRVDDDRSVPLYTEGYSLVLPPDHPLAAAGTVRGEDMADQPMIVRSLCEVLSETSRYFTDRNVRPPLVYRTRHDERALDMVSAGVGATVMPQSYQNGTAAFVNLEGFTPTRQIGLFRPRHELPQAMRAIADDFMQQAEDYFSGTNYR